MQYITKVAILSTFSRVCVAFKSLRIFVSIPVSVVEGERSFNKLSLVKGSTMLQEKLSALVVLPVKWELAITLDYNDIQ